MYDRKAEMREIAWKSEEGNTQHQYQQAVEIQEGCSSQGLWYKEHMDRNICCNPRSPQLRRMHEIRVMLRSILFSVV